MLAVILQQENAPNVDWKRKILQFGERTAQTYVQDINKRFGNPIGKLDNALGDVIYNGIYRGSSGFMNMSAGALESAVKHSEKFNNRPPIPAEIRFRQ